MTSITCKISVEIGNDGETATVRMSNRTRPFVVRVLGVDIAQGEIKTIYLDSLIHRHTSDLNYINWQPSGCVSTLLTKVEL